MTQIKFSWSPKDIKKLLENFQEKIQNVINEK